MDIGSGKVGPAGGLSNFRPRPFVFDGVECASMEGLLQSFKYDKVHMQKFLYVLLWVEQLRSVARNVTKLGSRSSAYGGTESLTSVTPTNTKNFWTGHLLLWLHKTKSSSALF